MNIFRLEKLNNLIKNEIATLLVSYHLPLELNNFKYLNIDKVILNKNISIAKVFYSQYKEFSFSPLDIKAFQFFIKKKLSKNLKMRKVPSILMIKSHFEQELIHVNLVLDNEHIE